MPQIVIGFTWAMCANTIYKLMMPDLANRLLQNVICITRIYKVEAEKVFYIVGTHKRCKIMTMKNACNYFDRVGGIRL